MLGNRSLDGFHFSLGRCRRGRSGRYGFNRFGDAVLLALGVLGFLALIPLVNRPEVADDARPDLAGFLALRAAFDFAGQVAVAAADAERRGDGEVRQAIGVGDLLDEAAAGLPVGYPLAQKHVQDRAAGVLALQLVLVVEGVERIVGAGVVPAWTMPGKRLASSLAKR